MRRFNVVLSIMLLILLLLHGVAGSLQMMGLSRTVLKTLAWTAMALTLLHIGIGIRLTADSIKVWHLTGAPYFKENSLFWIRRISGFAIIIFLVFHMVSFSYTQDGLIRLYQFNTFRLVTQILLIVSIALHLVTNIRPVMIALGIRNGRKWVLDILIVLSFLLLFMALGTVVYFIRWRAF